MVGLDQYEGEIQAHDREATGELLAHATAAHDAGDERVAALKADRLREAAGLMRATDIADSIGPRWPAVLEQLGIAPQFLVNRHGPCPACGGSDRYRFDNRNGRGGFFCNGCGAGDGFSLLQRVYGWDFRTARDRVLEAAGMQGSVSQVALPAQRSAAPASTVARPPARCRRMHAETCRLEDCPDAIGYLDSRGLWPAAAETTLRAHASVEYYDAGRRVDRFPALIANVTDAAGELVTLHTTYLANGQKLASHEPRKILSPMVGRQSCAVRLYPISGGSLGIAEGLETSIAAAMLHEMPVWAALNTSLLQKFTPPAGIERLVIFADRDLPGMTAAAALLERLQGGRVRVEIKTPPAPAKDWNDILLNNEMEAAMTNKSMSLPPFHRMPWYPRDFASATRTWPLVARGAFRELLDAQWDMGGSQAGLLPADPEELRELARATQPNGRSPGDTSNPSSHWSTAAVAMSASRRIAKSPSTNTRVAARVRRRPTPSAGVITATDRRTASISTRRASRERHHERVADDNASES